MNDYTYNIGRAKVVICDDYVPSFTYEIKSNLLDFYRAIWIVYGSFDNMFDYFYTLDEVSYFDDNGYILIE